MTCECVIALVTCVATIITTVIAVLSYLHDRKEQKIKPPGVSKMLDGFQLKTWR